MIFEEVAGNKKQLLPIASRVNTTDAGGPKHQDGISRANRAM